MQSIELALWAGAIVAGAVLWLDHRRLWRAMGPRPRPARLEHYPSVTVIRPIKDLDPELDLNARSGLDHGYPGEVQTLFVFDDEYEPGVPVVEKVVAEHRDSGRPGSADICFCGAPPAGRTGKLNAMLLGMRRAHGEVIVFADSDIRTDRDALRVLVETLRQTPDAGATFAPIVVSEPATGIADAACAMSLNGLYTPSASGLIARDPGSLPFLLGQFMAFERAFLDSLELDQMKGQLVDDLYIGALVREKGRKNVASAVPIRIIQYGLSNAEGVRNFSRWMTFSRTGIPQWSFKLPIFLRPVIFAVALVAAIVAASHGLLLGALPMAVLALAAVASINALHNRTGCAPLRPRHWIAPVVLTTVAPFVFARIYLLQKRMGWRGRVYELGRDSRLAEQE